MREKTLILSAKHGIMKTSPKKVHFSKRYKEKKVEELMNSYAKERIKELLKGRSEEFYACFPRHIRNILIALKIRKKYYNAIKEDKEKLQEALLSQNKEKFFIIFSKGRFLFFTEKPIEGFKKDVISYIKTQQKGYSRIFPTIESGILSLAEKKITVQSNNIDLTGKYLSKYESYLEQENKEDIDFKGLANGLVFGDDAQKTPIKVVYFSELRNRFEEATLVCPSFFEGKCNCIKEHDTFLIRPIFADHPILEDIVKEMNEEIDGEAIKYYDYFSNRATEEEMDLEKLRIYLGADNKSEIETECEKILSYGVLKNEELETLLNTRLKEAGGHSHIEIITASPEDSPEGEKGKIKIAINPSNDVEIIVPKSQKQKEPAKEKETEAKKEKTWEKETGKEKPENDFKSIGG